MPIPKPTSERAISKALKDVYYEPGGFVGAKKLQERLKSKGINTTVKFISEWLKKQSTHTLTVKPKKIQQYLSFTSNSPNDKHVADLAFFRHQSNGYKGILIVIDVYSRYACVLPFKSKTAESIAKLYKSMFDSTPLRFPNQLITDDGAEFKGSFKKMLRDNHVFHHVATPGVHTTTAIVDRFIYTLKERIIRQMNHSHSDSWDVMIRPLVESYNNDIHETTNCTPNAIMNDDVVPVLKERKIKKLPLLTVGSKVRVKLAEQKGIDRNRATDREYWSKKSYTIAQASYSPENIRYYRLTDPEGEANKHIFYHEEVLPIKK